MLMVKVIVFYHNIATLYFCKYNLSLYILLYYYMYNNVNLHTERAAMTISHALPMSEFVVSLNYVECNGTERTLTQCPHLDATCLNPGAGVSCPMQVQVVLTTELSTTMATTNTSNMTESPENEASRNSSIKCNWPQKSVCIGHCCTRFSSIDYDDLIRKV